MADEDYVKVASLDKLPPGEMMHVEIRGQWILLVNVDGEVHACSDVCPHQFPQLSYGELNGVEVSGPLHGPTFNVLTGDQLLGKYADVGSVAVYEVRLVALDLVVK